VHDESTVRGTESECKLDSKGPRVQRVRESKVEIAEIVSTENSRAQSREEGVECTMGSQCQNAESRVQSESTETRVQRLREYTVESAEIVSAESVSTVQEHSGESTKSRVQRVQGHRVERPRREHSAQ
jgi:hypothetical protein